MQRVIILGGGFAGLRVVSLLSKSSQFEVILIDRKDYFEVTFAQVAALTAPVLIGNRSRILYRHLTQVQFIQDNAIGITNSELILEKNDKLKFDFLIVATGSGYSRFEIGKPSTNLSLSQRNQSNQREYQKLFSAQKILIIGGGPVGVELAGEIKSKYKTKEVTLIHSGTRLLPFLKQEASNKAISLLKDIGVKVELNQRLQRLDEYNYQGMTNNKTYTANVVYQTTGAKPNNKVLIDYLPEALDISGQIIVDEFFKVITTENIYAIGDVNNVPEAKLGFLANLQGEHLSRNLIRMLSGKKLKKYKPHKTIAIVPIGRNKGVIQLPLLISGLKFLIRMKTKDFFIAKYLKLYSDK
jgi:NADH dehydrogenase FAD-containing subunit